LTALAGLVRRVAEKGATLILSGESGVGKTALLDHAAADGVAEGLTVLRCGGAEFDADVSFSSLARLLLPVHDEIERLTPENQRTLRVALGFTPDDGPAIDQLLVCHAVLELFRTAAERAPVLLVVDDLPWLDRASAGVLGFVARRLEGSHVGLLGASRTGEADFFDRSGLAELEVRRLGDEQARSLVDARYPDLSAAVRDRIVLEAQGIPLALLELPAALDGAARATGATLPPTLPLGRRLQAVFGSRILALPPRTRRLLLLMALDGTGDVRVLEAGEGGGFEDLTAAEQARLAYVDGSSHRLAFHHPLMRSAVVDLSPASERREAHRVLAEMWSDQLERRAWHLAEATLEPDESVAALLQAAAERILARGDAVGCVKVLTRASELSPRSVDRRRRLAAAAYVGAEVAGDLGDASRVLADLRRGDTELEGSLQAALAASAFLLNADGDVVTAHRLLVRAIEHRDRSGDSTGPTFEEALHTLMMVCYYGGSAELWGQFEAIAVGVSEAREVIRNSRTLGDPARTAAAALPALDAAIASLDQEPSPSRIVRIGIAAVHVDRMEGCREALWRVVHDARQGGAVASGILALIILAYDDYWSGEWDEAHELIDEVIRLTDSLGYALSAWPAKLVQALIDSARGDDRRTAELEAVVEWARPRGYGVVEWYACHARTLAALGRGDFDEAFRLASRISPPGTFVSHIPHAFAVLFDLVEAAVHTGRDAEAHAHVAAMHEAGLAGLSTRLALVVGGATAMVASDERAPALFQAALALPGIERWRFDLARVRLAYGERLRRQRAMSEARAQLDAALETFERQGARPWAARATIELRATGRTKPRAGENVLDRLTPQEYEIAGLAASGLTNKQIGERLFLSHRTVGGHLHRAFPKLGVTTRAGLRDALDSLPPEQLPHG
jgi:DNA-binding CsgD family transcriptional regulator